jgi:hypothetical protein
MLQKFLIVLWLVAISLITAACEDSAMAVSGVLPPQGYDGIDPVFREDFDMLGGQEILGLAISPSFEKNNVRYQYTAAALMVRDTNAGQNDIFHLAALGYDMGVAEPPIPEPPDPDGRYVDGHVIHSAFLPLYDRLQGERYVGKPLTEAHHNLEAQRVEQYFENLGMYWLDSEGPEHVRLLNYGAWKCNASCRSLKGDEGGVVVLPFRTDKVFKEAVARLGADFTGFAIKEAYKTPDDYTEQIFENVVLVADPETPSRVFVRPIVEALGFKADPLTVPSGRDGYEFYPVKDGLGYNIPKQFADYIARHGGMDASGPPITELFQDKNNIERQCFTNLCLEMLHKSSGEPLVRPAQLGFLYKMLALRPINLRTGKTAPPSSQSEAGAATAESPPPAEPQATEASFSGIQGRELTMRVWESYAMLSPNQNQEIGISLYENNTPMPNMEPILELTFPDGQEKTYYMLPSGEDGVSTITIAPIDQPNGSLISYQVCIFDLTYERYCVKDSFMMWQNP